MSDPIYMLSVALAAWGRIPHLGSIMITNRLLSGDRYRCTVRSAAVLADPVPGVARRPDPISPREADSRSP